MVDLYTAEVLEILGKYGKLPQPDWSNVRVVVTTAMARMYGRKGNEAFVKRMVPHGMSAKKLSATPEKWVVMVRPSLMRDYARSGVAPSADDAWSWSMWRGYLKNDDGRLVSNCSMMVELEPPTFTQVAMLPQLRPEGLRQQHFAAVAGAHSWGRLGH